MPKKSVTVYLEPEDYQKFKQVSEKHDRGVSYVIRDFALAALEEHYQGSTNDEQKERISKD